LRDIVRGPPINRATMVRLPQPLYGLPVTRSVIPAAGILGRTRREFVTREATEQLH